MPPHARFRSGTHEAFATAKLGRALVIYFTDGGAIEADLSDFSANGEVRWLDLGRAAWFRTTPVGGRGWASHFAPAEGSWIALVQPRAPAR